MEALTLLSEGTVALPEFVCFPRRGAPLTSLFYHMVVKDVNSSQIGGSVGGPGPLVSNLGIDPGGSRRSVS